MDGSKINKFTQFKRHVDNVGERIEAEDINIIQETINKEETENIKTKDDLFTNQALFVLENHFSVNSGFIDEIDDGHNIDYQNSRWIIFDEKESAITIDNHHMDWPDEECFFKTVPINGDSTAAFLNDFLLLVDVEQPKGSTIEYFISTDYGDFPIKPDKENTTVIEEKIIEFQLKIVMKENNLGEAPIIKGLCVLFFDILLEKQYGLINPDLSRFAKESFGDTILIRDRGLNDKLIRVISPEGVTDLVYRGDGKLDFIESIEGQDQSRTILNYGDYFDSNGVISEKLLGTTTEKIETKDTDKSPFEGGDASAN